jgi:hypothetical protein
MTPEERVGKTANLVIFLGILSTVLSVITLIGRWESTVLLSQIITLGAALGVIALGYGIRYGSRVCLYLTTGLGICLVGYFASTAASLPTVRTVLRLALSVWVLVGLCRAIPAMRILHRTHSRPVSTSRFGEFFLRRKAP